MEETRLSDRVALITGITGQDGSYMADLLLEKGYHVFGMVRQSASPNMWRIKHLEDKITLLHGDLTDSHSLDEMLNILNTKVDGSVFDLPFEVYNFAAHSFVGNSWQSPESVMNINAVGVARLLNALRRQMYPDVRFYQASSSEMFGKVKETPQTEATPFYPRSPYGVSKVSAYWTSVNFRESWDMHISNGILFNHESPRRGGEFVTQKIVREAVRIENAMAAGDDYEPLVLGNLSARRDWGHAKDYVRAAWMMLQQEEPDDYVIATGRAYSVRDFVESAFTYGYPIWWEGTGMDEVGRDTNGNIVVSVSEEFYRPAEVDLLMGDASKAKAKLGWKPSVDLWQLVEDMKQAAEQNPGQEGPNLPVL